MAEYGLAELAEEAGLDMETADTDDGSSTSSGDGGDGVNESTLEFLSQTLQMADQRGLIDGVLFGPEYSEELQKRVGDGQQAEPEAAEGDGEMSEIELDSDMVILAGEKIMSTLGEDATLDDVLAEAETAKQSIEGQLGPNTTVSDVVDIAKNNPELVDAQLDEVKSEL